MLSWDEHEKSFITSGPGHTQTSLLSYIDKLVSRKSHVACLDIILFNLCAKDVPFRIVNCVYRYHIFAYMPSSFFLNNLIVCHGPCPLAVPVLAGWVYGFLWFYVPKAQPAVNLVLKRLRRRDNGLKSLPTYLEKPRIEPATPGLQHHCGS